MEAQVGDDVVEKLTEGSENGTKDGNELVADALSHVNKTPYFETDSIIIDTETVQEAERGDVAGRIVDAEKLPRDDDALLSSATARPTVIVPNPVVARSVSVPCSSGQSAPISLNVTESSSTLALVRQSSSSPSSSAASHPLPSPDSTIDKLRIVNPEHLKVLCRSYITSLVNCPELELMLKEDDTNSSRSGNRKAGRRTRTFSLSSTSKKAKPLSHVGAIFGNPLTQEGIAQITQLFDFLSQEENLKTEGLFRKTGNIARQRELKVLLDTGSEINLADRTQNFSAHDCANVLKSFLGELPEPLLQEKYYGAHCQVPELSDAPLRNGGHGNTKKRAALQLLFLLLPRESYLLLQSLLRLLKLVASHADSNRMTSATLGTLFAPHVLCPRSMTPVELQNAVTLVSKSVEFMIDNVETLFTAPPELVQSAEMFLRRRNEVKAAEESFGSSFTKANDNMDSSTEGLLSPTAGKRSKRHRRGSTGERHLNIFGFGSDSGQGGRNGRGRHPSSPATTPAGPPDSPGPVDPMLHFVDQKTSQAADEGSTRKALQDLYANIQSMPEGPTKRKYLKMMRQNHGLGNPIPVAAETPTEDRESPKEEERRGRKHSRSRSFGEALGNFKRVLSRKSKKRPVKRLGKTLLRFTDAKFLTRRGRHQRSRSSSRNRAAGGRRNAGADTDKDDAASGRDEEDREDDENVEHEKRSTEIERDDDESPPQKAQRSGEVTGGRGGGIVAGNLPSGPWVHRQHSKGIISSGTTLSPIAMSPMDQHGHHHTPVIAAATASPISRKHSASSSGVNSSTPKIAPRGLAERASQRGSALPSSVTSLRHVSSSSSSSSLSSPKTKPLKPTNNFSDKLLSLSEQSKASSSCGTPHGKTGTVLHRGSTVNSGVERVRSPLPSKFALSVAQSQQQDLVVTDVVLADDEARV